MRVLGIDPGTVRMGYGVVDASPQPEADDYGVIALPSSLPLEKRLYQLHTHILNMIHIFRPDAIAVEDPFVGKGERRFVGPAIAVGQAQALVFIGAASQDVPVFRYTPAQIKRAVVDYGAATKEQMQRTIAATLGLTDLPESDAADALSVGLCHLVHSNAASVLGREIPPGRER
ncbi:MAG TPA: crossover junction endodeoxyribonuclease RuvC [Dehalococcoidia bacterium]|nr:crossover junction endodeoxyribonuclease RuvC [Dehalococcoidia bacterium]